MLSDYPHSCSSWNDFMKYFNEEHNDALLTSRIKVILEQKQSEERHGWESDFLYVVGKQQNKY